MKIYFTALLTLVLFLLTTLLFLIIFGLNDYNITITPNAILDVDGLINNSDNLQSIQYFENMRFPSKNITYSINDSCEISKIISIKRAFRILENETNYIKFTQVLGNDSDININCNNSFEKNHEDYIKLGEGGFNNVIRSGNIHIINKGKVILYNKSSNCVKPNVEIHEILHTFGFSHSNNNNSIMYSFSNCNQIITEEIKEKINELYSIPEFPDIKIDEVNVTRDRRYAEINISILNEGLKDSGNVTVELSKRNYKISDFEIGEVKKGRGLTIRIKNLDVSNTDYVDVFLKGDIELDMLNNQRRIKV